MCDKCWGARYVLRAITLPVAGPIDVTWAELRERLRLVWGQSTRLCNWAVAQLRMRDITRTPDLERLPTMPHIYLYPEARALHPDIDPQSLNCLLHSVDQRYRRARYECVWTGAVSLPSYRYPTPYPTHNAAWHPEWTSDKQPCVSVRLAGERITLKLRGGAPFRYQRRAFEDLVEGRAVQATLELYRQRASRGDHRLGMSERKAGGGDAFTYRVMAKLVAWLPRDGQTPRRGGAGTLVIRTTPTSFLEAQMAGDTTPWVLHADHVRQWVAEHRRRLRRLADDRKVGKRAAITRVTERLAAKQSRRMGSFVRETASAVTKLATRRRVAEVQLDDRCKDYVESFPWFQLRQRLAVVLDEAGIIFHHASDDVEQATPESLEGPESED